MKIKMLNILCCVLLFVMMASVLVPMFVPTATTGPSTGGSEEGENPDGGDDDDVVVPPIPGEVLIKTAEELVEKALSYINGTNSLKFTLSGTATAAGITQKLVGNMSRDSLGKVLQSTGTVQTGAIGKTVAVEAFYNKGDAYTRMTNKVDNSYNGIYTDLYEKYSTEPFLDKFGYIPGKCNYIIDKDTIISYNSYIETDSTRSCTIVLDAKASAKHYSKSVKVMSGSTTQPDFSKVEIKFVTTPTGIPISLTIDEIYGITMGLSLNCVGRMTYKYSKVGQYFTISTPQGI